MLQIIAYPCARWRNPAPSLQYCRPYPKGVLHLVDFPFFLQSAGITFPLQVSLRLSALGPRQDRGQPGTLPLYAGSSPPSSPWMAGGSNRTVARDIYLTGTAPGGPYYATRVAAFRWTGPWVGAGGPALWFGWSLYNAIHNQSSRSKGALVRCHGNFHDGGFLPVVRPSSVQAACPAAGAKRPPPGYRYRPWSMVARESRSSCRFEAAPGLSDLVSRPPPWDSARITWGQRFGPGKAANSICITETR